MLSQMKAVRINASSSDAAIDLERSDIQQYAKTRDEKHLVFSDGSAPDRFVIRKLNPSEIATINDLYAARPNQKALLAFMLAVQQIELSDGSVMEITKEEMVETVVGGKKVTAPGDKWIERVIGEFSYDSVLEIGQVAIDFAGLGKRAIPFFNCWVGMVQKV